MYSCLGTFTNSKEIAKLLLLVANNVSRAGNSLIRSSLILSLLIRSSLIRSFYGNQMSNCERFAQIAPDKWANQDKFAHDKWANERFAQKNLAKKSKINFFCMLYIGFLI